MTFDEAAKYLNGFRRAELVDRTFSDAEISWWSDEEAVADGYFSRKDADVFIGDTKFSGDEAKQLRDCGSSVTVTYNDAGNEDG